MEAGKTVVTPAVREEFEKIAGGIRGSIAGDVEEALEREAVLDHAAPDFSLEQVGGGRVSLAELRGKIVVLDFWYKDCPYCMIAVPTVERLVETYGKRGVVFLGMNVDRQEEDARAAIRQMHITYPSLRTDFDFAKRFGIHAYPTFVVIDGAGVVRHFHAGAGPDLDLDLGKCLEGLIGKGAAVR